MSDPIRIEPGDARQRALSMLRELIVSVERGDSAILGVWLSSLVVEEGSGYTPGPAQQLQVVYRNQRPLIDAGGERVGYVSRQ